eukprot:CAMPEP_0177779660 /NCGR_PEP_ID=MMETSP0491_2-20121128/16728_1 /TAXON_ID=63592 /ORGANISM="Tetraselmis chuii, Strain PLY429" /LENGTH=119 /DNA_ID=CAMNT_0019299259 /DNA_START=240 /DNA_END=597 /DNA_ORIENTATION=+
MAPIILSRLSFASPLPSSDATRRSISASVVSARAVCVPSNSSILAASSSSSSLSVSHSAASAFHRSTAAGSTSTAFIISANGHLLGSPPSGCPAGLLASIATLQRVKELPEMRQDNNLR